MASLAFRITEPGGKPREVDTVDQLTIGRGDANALKLADPKASSKHARVIVEGDDVWIEDVGSSNHTLILNGPILEQGQRYRLAPGVTVQIGDSMLVVIARGEAAAAAGSAGKTVAAHIAFGSGEPDSETSDGSAGGMLSSLAEVAIFKTAQPRLVICNEAIRRIDVVDKVSWLVGRGEAANCAIEHPAVSGSHARILFVERRFFLEDLGSRNGSYVNGEKVAPNSRLELPPDAHVRFGSIEALFAVDVDADGRTVDRKRAMGALTSLVNDGVLTRLQRDEVEREADGAHPGVVLLHKGYARVDQWRDALRKGEFLAISKDVGSSSGGLRGLLVLVAALLVVLIVLLLVKPELLQAIGLGGKGD